MSEYFWKSTGKEVIVLSRRGRLANIANFIAVNEEMVAGGMSWVIYKDGIRHDYTRNKEIALCEAIEEANEEIARLRQEVTELKQQVPPLLLTDGN